jgi:hypothetical protein
MIWIIGWILLWFRPEYRFVLFFGFALLVFDLIFYALFGGAAIVANPGALSTSDILAFITAYAIDAALGLAIFFTVGALIVTLRTWMKARTSPQDQRLDAEMERVRAEIAARDGQPPATS